MTNALDSSLVVFLQVASSFLETFLKICWNLNFRCGAVLIQLCVKIQFSLSFFMCLLRGGNSSLNPAVTWISWQHYYHICNFWQLFHAFHHFDILWFFFLKSPNLTTSGTKWHVQLSATPEPCRGKQHWQRDLQTACTDDTLRKHPGTKFGD